MREIKKYELCDKTLMSSKKNRVLRAAIRFRFGQITNVNRKTAQRKEYKPVKGSKNVCSCRVIGSNGLFGLEIWQSTLDDIIVQHV